MWFSRAGTPGGAPEGDMWQQDQSQLSQAGVWEAGRAQAVSHACLHRPAGHPRRRSGEPLSLSLSFSIELCRDRWRLVGASRMPTTRQPSQAIRKALGEFHLLNQLLESLQLNFAQVHCTNFYFCSSTSWWATGGGVQLLIESRLTERENLSFKIAAKDWAFLSFSCN